MCKYNKKAYNELPFKSIILHIISILLKKGFKKIKKNLEYVKETKELSVLQIGKGKNNLIKIRNDLIVKFKKNSRRKKEDRDYYEYEENKYYGLKDIRNLFNQNDDNDDIYEDIECLFSENEEIKEYANNIYEIIKEKKVEYCEIIEEVEDKKVECFELIDDKKDEYYEIIEDKEIEIIEFYESIEDQKAEYCKLVENQEKEIIEEKTEFELIEDQKVDYYEEIKELLYVKSKKECREYVINEGIIKQEEAINYDVNFYRVNYRRGEKVREFDYIKYKPTPIVEFEIIKYKKIKKPVVYEIIDELIEKIGSSE